MNHNEEQWLSRFWDQQCASLDKHTLDRLAEARALALSQVSQRAPFRIPGWSLPAFAVAASALLALAVWVWKPPSESALRASDAVYLEDAAVLASNEDPGLYTEDPEFLEWSNAQIHAHGT
jgi:hypothetical protein